MDEGLAAAAADLADLAAAVAPELAAEAARVAERTAARSFHISVVGEFKRGKSTLVNALLGRSVLPTGVLPLTAVPIEVAHGTDGAVGAVVRLADGRERSITLDDLPAFATEAGNPGNRRGVACVRVTVPCELLATGAVLVDTPGLGSVHAHNTAAAREALVRTDGAVVVLSADAPLSAEEHALLAALRDRSAGTFVVLNRVDHLDPAERRVVVAFVQAALAEQAGTAVPLYPVSARAALAARLGEGPPDAGFDAFLRDLRRFVEADLAGTRRRAAARQVHSLADRVDAAVELEAAAAALDVEELDRRVSRFAHQVRQQRDRLEEDRVLLGAAVERIVAGLAADLAGIRHEPPAGAVERFEAVAAAIGPSELELALDAEVAACVLERFEALRPEVARRVEDAWEAAAGEFRGRVERRALAVHDAAADLFDRTLPPVPVPALASVPGGFTYQLERLPRSGEGIGRRLRLLLPRPWLRRRLLRVAQRRLAEQLDRHAGRVRADLTERLARAAETFDEGLTAHLEEVVAAITGAAARARGRRDAAGARTAAEHRRVTVVRSRTDAARAGAGPDGRA